MSKIYGRPVATPINPNKFGSGGGGFVASETAPEDKSKLWVDLNDNSGESAEKTIASFVRKYLEENPAQVGATKEEAEQIQQNKADIEKLNTDKLDADKLPEAVNDALAQAKASGEFKGDPGEPGQPGNDYILTEADKQEIASMVEVPGGGNGDSVGGGSAEWRLLDTFDLSSGALSYTADTTGCREILFVTEVTIVCNGGMASWKGVSKIYDATKTVGAIGRYENVVDGLILATRTRDTTEPLANIRVYFGADQTNNNFIFTCSAATSGIFRIYGR